MKRVEFTLGAIGAAAFAALPMRAIAAESDYDLTTSHGTISGTSTVPDGVAKPPVVLIIAGSGPTDRDGNSGAPLRTDAYKMLAVALAGRGIATVRFDKRLVGKSAAAGPSEETLRFDHYVGDAAGWIGKLRADGRFGKVAIAGHSEGSLVGMMAAARAPVDAFVSLDGAGRPAADTLRAQLSDRLKAAPALLAASNRILDSLVAGKTADDVPPALVTLYRPSIQPYLISWFRYDPAAELRKVRAPVGIVQGTADLQVPVEDAKLLAAAVPSAKFVLVQGMSHVLKHVADGATLQQQVQTAYSDPTIPLEPAVVQAIAGTLA
jgi:pimeloyl-ACP methyl ester carboxylesterase